MESPSPALTKAVGERVDDRCGSLGTVRYVGPVATAEDPSALIYQQYIGIEWDDWGRGTNDGSVTLPSGDRVVYFMGPAGRLKAGHGNALSLNATKMDNMTERSSLVERLQQKYGTNDASDVGSGDVIVAGQVGTTLGRGKSIEFVGAQKLRTQQTLENVGNISLSGCQIAELGADKGGKRLEALVPNLTELDLSRNLFTKWTDILAVVRELPRLETLILSGNRFTLEEESGREDNTVRFEHLKVLVLNQTLLSWDQVVKLVTRHFPKLEALYLVDNEYADDQLSGIHPKASWTETLAVLDLSRNRLTSWKNLLTTIGGTFVNLKKLFLNENRIVSLVLDTEKPLKGFQQLTSLSLSDNLVESWTSIDALSAFPLLDTLRFSKNPLTTQISVGEARLLLIARTDHIAVLNASHVRDTERKEAEQLYLKRILHELAVVDNDTNERDRVLRAHPRYSRLRDLYPEIARDFTNSETNLRPRKLASSLIKVTILPMTMQAISLEPVVKKIPQQLKVSQLKLLIETTFGVDVAAQVLSFRASAKVSGTRSIGCAMSLSIFSSRCGYLDALEFANGARR
ncbi:hypothetical protein PsorP6_017685 [Peronosclerospora sorghi]|uniref:Uncharacterized protein n=1 Tax=Peronosclerospora sorghi TaxID=230839 RepID=A0ACC0WLE0_9STRA|nr:hypothetical protein PsorP6_017685 [Peronosclerospora sorghi]